MTADTANRPDNVTQISRRTLLAAAAWAAAGIAILAALAMVSGCAANDNGFDFLLLGDMHLDQMSHHDMDWLKREKPNVIRQCQAYSRFTRETAPLLFDELGRQIESNDRIKFVAQLGDFVQGLAGTPELARKHHADAVKFVRDAKLGVPFLLTKGNHDIVGPGAPESFDAVLRPFIGTQLARLTGRLTDIAATGAPRKFALQKPHASYAFTVADTLFVSYDGFAKESLDWLEGILAKRSEKHFMFMVHYPPVPYSPRATWGLYAPRSQRKQRARLLNLLGEHRAIVLSGHLHDYGIVVRRTDKGAFVQVATCSVLPKLPVKPTRKHSGVASYGPDIVEIDPKIKPGGKSNTEEKRRAFLEAEKPFIAHYEYALAPGYALISIRTDGVSAKFFCGLKRTPWRTVNLTDLLQDRNPGTPYNGPRSSR